MEIGSFNNVSADFKKALDKASKDGKITKDEVKDLLKEVETEDDLTILKNIAIKDDNKEDKSKLEFKIGSGDADSEYKLAIDSNDFTLEKNKLKQDIKSGKEVIQITYADDVVKNNKSSASKATTTVVGNYETARTKLRDMIPDNKKKQWDNLNKHNINDVKKFMNSLNLSTEEKVNFVQKYLTGYYNHPGEDVQWIHSMSLQKSIDTVPKDSAGRKYVDCEGFAAIGTELLSTKDNKVKTYLVDATPDGISDERDHQISVYREGNKAYVISNNDIRPVELEKSDKTLKTDEEAIAEAYQPEGFSKIKEDKSGAMKVGVGEWDAGDVLKSPDHTATVESIDEDKGTLTASLENNYGEKYKVEGKIGTDGQLHYTRQYEKDDEVLFMDKNKETKEYEPNGQKMKITDVDKATGKFSAVITNEDGEQTTVSGKLDGKGRYTYKVNTGVGDTVTFTDKSKLKVDTVDDKGNYTGTYTDKNNDTYNVKGVIRNGYPSSPIRVFDTGDEYSFRDRKGELTGKTLKFDTVDKEKGTFTGVITNELGEKTTVKGKFDGRGGFSTTVNTSAGDTVKLSNGRSLLVESIDADNKYTGTVTHDDDETYKVTGKIANGTASSPQRVYSVGDEVVLRDGKGKDTGSKITINSVDETKGTYEGSITNKDYDTWDVKGKLSGGNPITYNPPKPPKQ